MITLVRVQGRCKSHFSDLVKIVSKEAEERLDPFVYNYEGLNQSSLVGGNYLPPQRSKNPQHQR